MRRSTPPTRLSHVPLGLAEQTDGKLIVVGSFTTYGGVTIGKHMRLNADGRSTAHTAQAAG